MFYFIGFTVCWLVVVLIASMVINTFRAKGGGNINDPVTAFFEGFMWGPMSVLSAFNEKQIAQGKSGGMLWGGILGTISYIYWLLHFWPS